MDSFVYQWFPSEERFRLSQRIQTHGATSVDYMNIDGNHYVLFANSKSSSSLYKYNFTGSAGFMEVQKLPTMDAKSAKFLIWNNTGESCLTILLYDTV